MCCIVKSFVKWIISCVCCLIVIAVAILIALYFAIKPKKPSFNVVNVQTVDDRPSLFDISGDNVLPNVGFVLSSYNPNKVEIEYQTNNSLKVLPGSNVTKQSQPLGQAFLNTFSQGAKTQKNVTANWLSANRVDPDVMTVLQANLTNDLIVVTLSGRLQARGVYGGLRSPGVYVDIKCYVGFKPNSSMLASEYTECGVDIPFDQT
ncbi:hypothetical protein CBR_g498 [Chara braunii]|uniref:Late embryogenesis abundant protein LEA-2 subgroup domain-containing protein n=1 Tax=Chara braunii TaxID=69332 RepID=A0A388KBC3_CHABU|nr:hypothetical protein CBR_g498 [Chara braunii]|eukprot:GBG67362.1 hypothetical protein CBR_g498 [Chara braunii]